ncbi:MAG: dihydroorotate dehydrogenase (quinone) [Alphaproteobacteria bacterium]|nr:MAG: dihydroorotate dehydrogenase (quinone) [Alphaproteobacteria bacterium]
MISKIALPFLRCLDAEKAHNLTLSALKTGLMTRKAKTPSQALSLSLFGRVFPNPVGLAAGFDKNSDVPDAMLGYGFGFVEVGTVTPKPQEGNPKPRVFRDVSSKSVINRMGFPNGGSDVFEENYQKFREDGKNKNGIVGINVGKNKDQDDALADYVALVHRFGKQADYLTVNISSPNTAGLRDLQNPDELLPFLRQLVIVRNARCKTPLLVKLAPDLDEQQCKDIAKCVLESGIDGLILTNTTLDRPETLPQAFRAQMGGLSGCLLQEKSLNTIRIFYKELGGKIPIIGAGGIDDAQSAYAKIKAGASLVQLYTGLVYQGPALPAKINHGILKLLRQDRYSSIAEAIGADHK